MSLHARLLESGTTISVAESCTGGLVGDSLSANCGSSNYFAGGLVVYNELCKVDVLGVRQNTIDTYGAESEECAISMAIQACNKFRTQWGVSTTGNIEHGPVYCALFDRHTQSIYTFNTSFEYNDRVSNKRQVVSVIHDKLLEAMATMGTYQYDEDMEEERFIKRIEDIDKVLSQTNWTRQKLENAYQLGIELLYNRHVSSIDEGKMCDINSTIQEALADLGCLTVRTL